MELNEGSRETFLRIQKPTYLWEMEGEPTKLFDSVGAERDVITSSGVARCTSQVRQSAGGAPLQGFGFQRYSQYALRYAVFW